MEPAVERREHRPRRWVKGVRARHTAMEPAERTAGARVSAAEDAVGLGATMEPPWNGGITCWADDSAHEGVHAAMEPAIERRERVGVTVLDGQLVIAAMEPAAVRREHDRHPDQGGPRHRAAMEAAVERRKHRSGSPPQACPSRSRNGACRRTAGIAHRRPGGLFIHPITGCFPTVNLATGSEKCYPHFHSPR